MIDLTRRNDDVGFAARLALMLRALETPDPVGYLRSQFPNDFPTAVTMVYSPLSHDMPCYVIANMINGVLVLIAGCHNVFLGRLTLDGYSGLPREDNALGASPYFYRVATTIVDDMIRAGYSLSGTIRICGHSLGGAIGATLYAHLKQVYNPTNVAAITLNACRYGRDPFINRFLTGEVTRYFCDDDPVQFIPCHADEAPLAHVLLVSNTGFAFNQQTNPTLGTKVTTTGTLATAFQPTGPLPNTTLSILDWLMSGCTGRYNPHMLDEISRRMQAAADAMEPLETVRARAAATERPATIRVHGGVLPVPPPILTRAETDRIVQASRSLVAAAAAAQRTLFGPVTPLSEPFRAARRNGEWCVTWAGNVVAGCQGKHDAKTLSKACNKVTRAEGTSRAVLPIAAQQLIESVIDPSA